MVGKATPDRGSPRKTPDGVDHNIRRTRKTQRDGHNSGVKIWSLCSVSSTLSHANLEQPFRTLAIKWEVTIIVKKSSCVVCSCVYLSACVCLYYYWVVMIRQMSIQHKLSISNYKFISTGKEKAVSSDSHHSPFCDGHLKKLVSLCLRKWIYNSQMTVCWVFHI